VKGGKRVCSGAYGTNACQHTDVADFPPPLLKWTFPLFFRDRIIIVVETTKIDLETSATDECSSQSTANDSFRPFAEESTILPQCNQKRCLFFVPLQQFTNILAHLYRLRSLLLTGGHVITSSVPQVAVTTSKHEDDGRNDDGKLSPKHQKQLSRDATCYDESECGICMDALSNIVLPCTHEFCYTCARTWINAHSHCPLCRRHIPPKDVEKEVWQVHVCFPNCAMPMYCSHYLIASMVDLYRPL